jgi:hypothetical protein
MMVTIGNRRYETRTEISFKRGGVTYEDKSQMILMQLCLDVEIIGRKTPKRIKLDFDNADFHMFYDLLMQSMPEAVQVSRAVFGQNILAEQLRKQQEMLSANKADKGYG